jgi:hypothetical protein
MMLIVSQRPSLSIDGEKPEAQDTLQTNLGTGMRAIEGSLFESFLEAMHTLKT